MTKAHIQETQMYDDAYSPTAGRSPPGAEPAQQIANTRLAVRETLALAADRVGGRDLAPAVRRAGKTRRMAPLTFRAFTCP